MLLSRKNKKYFYKFVKNNLTIRAGIGGLQKGTWNQATKMSDPLNEQFKSVFSTTEPTMTIQYPKDFLGHPQ